MLKKSAKNHSKEKFFTLSEFRHKAGIPLVLAKKLISIREVESTKNEEGITVVAESEVMRFIKLMEKPWIKSYYFFRALGPGFITGASDDDPSGIGTYSSVGAKFGLGIIWMAAWLLPMMMAIQEVCARIGIVTNHGLAGVLQRHYKKKIVASIVVMLIIANVVNIGADLGAMAASLQMLTNINFYLAAILFAVLSIVLEIFIGYYIYVKILKWLAFSVLAYVVAGIIIDPEWREIFHFTIIPRFTFSQEYIFAIIAVFGTSITPYLFFWQTSGEVEENKFKKKMQKLMHKKLRINNHNRINKMRSDVGTGMILANVVFFFIVLTTAQVLFKNGVTNIESAHQAAEALRPFAGDHAYLLFAFGIIGTGLLAVPILAGSGAYALAEVMKWREGLDNKFSHAKGFYLVIIFSILVGLSLNFFNINPITALYYAAFLNGIISLPLLIAIMVVGNDKKIMGRETNPGWVKFFGWLAIIFITSAIMAGGILYFVK
ncbi:MAG: NRAMP family Mn2+/Fe2+ transporter [Candidatus Moranbacteria bacterium GW2011_GWF2_34_56]|nr:MAG: NRAMP family Mn2+/Fe2+ transporter [Candidatus Moranbacteria bacterium GW2011_GWF1_34_10]KKP64791.1 MAG: NRAMP family Mn2+/Fe2+ transporter [Candidatus Moranbacteria bacterium GW2011_GWF2_34_56]HBI16857.1 iron transporter [Candidatus Moranbacteria bacterium]